MALLHIRTAQPGMQWWHPGRWDPWRDFEALRDRVQRMDEQLRGDAQLVDEAVSYGAALNVCETETAFVVTADLPGVRESDVEISLEGTILSIRGSRAVAGEGAVLLNERVAGRFARTIALPGDLMAEQVRATLSHGVLEIVMPKRPAVERRKVVVAVTVESD